MPTPVADTAVHWRWPSETIGLSGTGRIAAPVATAVLGGARRGAADAALLTMAAVISTGSKERAAARIARKAVWFMRQP